MFVNWGSQGNIISSITMKNIHEFVEVSLVITVHTLNDFYNFFGKVNQAQIITSNVHH